ncbi:MAG: GTP 3',8-cyclase MoaA [Bacteroidetes bacterium]|nr:GTP 3',8-cyclase MoaA [Bacteroidota bacterium]MCY4232691.1 GTP 3',8-cyclase MoaA [Bacteroidota bacterium]
MIELKVLPNRSKHSPSQVLTDLQIHKSLGQGDVLVDGFGRNHTYLRISLIEQCNLRCKYCMPDDGIEWTPDENLLTDQEIIRLARLFVNQGVTKIRLTGGEPLLRPGIATIAEELGAMSKLKTLAITTNALLLKRNLHKLHSAGLNLINISLDSLQRKRFIEITRRDALDCVLEAIDSVLDYGFNPLKINCVVMRGINDDEIPDFVKLTIDRKIEVRFIEFMPFDGNQWNESQLVPYHEILDRIRQTYTLDKLSYGMSETAKLYKVRGASGHIGLITSMTDHFCSDCNRLRITADGHLKVCLFGRNEVNLRNALRDGAKDEDLLSLINDAVGAKHAKHAGMHLIANSKNRPMIAIGG